VELADGVQRFGVTDAVAPLSLYTGKVDWSSEGSLVAIQGFVAREDGREIYIDDGSGEVLVYIDATTKIRWPNLHIGDPAQIVGVVTRFRGEPEILPRFQSDAQFGVMLLPVAGEQNAFVPGLRGRGRIGEPLAVMRRVKAKAGAQLANTKKSIVRAQGNATGKAKSGPLVNDPLALMSFFLFGAAGVSGAVAIRKYMTTARDRSEFCDKFKIPHDHSN